MRPINSRIDTGSAQFTENRTSYESLIATLRERQQCHRHGAAGDPVR